MTIEEANGENTITHAACERFERERYVSVHMETAILISVYSDKFRANAYKFQIKLGVICGFCT